MIEQGHQDLDPKAHYTNKLRTWIPILSVKTYQQRELWSFWWNTTRKDQNA